MREFYPPKLTKWKPKCWRPEYERVVAYSCLGWSARMIREQLIAQGIPFTVQHISNILNLDEAEVIRKAILEKMRIKVIEDIPNDMAHIAQKTMRRLRTIIDDEEQFAKSPFAIIDRGLKVVEGLGHFRAGKVADGGTHIDKAIIINGDAASNLAEGLRMANQVLNLQPKELKVG